MQIIFDRVSMFKSSPSSSLWFSIAFLWNNCQPAADQLPSVTRFSKKDSSYSPLFAMDSATDDLDAMTFSRYNSVSDHVRTGSKTPSSSQELDDTFLEHHLAYIPDDLPNTITTSPSRYSIHLLALTHSLTACSIMFPWIHNPLFPSRPYLISRLRNPNVCDAEYLAVAPAPL